MLGSDAHSIACNNKKVLDCSLHSRHLTLYTEWWKWHGRTTGLERRRSCSSAGDSAA